jgi:CHAT domain-containing protein
MILRDATTSQLLSQLSDHRIVHISTHGRFRNDNPLFSHLTTADGVLFVADLLGVRLGSELIVLSACESGNTLLGETDELSGVAHEFLAAGAMRLVASRWRIHDEATQTLMDAFYEAILREGWRDADLALVEAQQNMRRRWGHPFYWAGFSVFGA